MSDTSVEAVKPKPRHSWKGHSERVGAGDESTESCRVVQPLHIHWRCAQCAAHKMLLDKLMSCCAARTNGCLDLRCHTFALCGQVSTEWSKCPGSMGWHASDSVTPL